MDMFDVPSEDNVFCAAIMEVLKIPGILDGPDPPRGINLDLLREDLYMNGTNCYSEEDWDNGKDDEHLTKRKPLAALNMALKVNKYVSKKALKMAKAQKQFHCRFCENNQESSQVVNSHSLRDNAGRLTCPRLRKYRCPICGASGDNAHTVRYCTQKSIYRIKGDQCDIEKVRKRTNLHSRITIRM